MPSASCSVDWAPSLGSAETGRSVMEDGLEDLEETLDESSEVVDFSSDSTGSMTKCSSLVGEFVNVKLNDLVGGFDNAFDSRAETGGESLAILAPASKVSSSAVSSSCSEKGIELGTSDRLLSGGASGVGSSSSRTGDGAREADGSPRTEEASEAGFADDMDAE